MVCGGGGVGVDSAWEQKKNSKQEQCLKTAQTPNRLLCGLLGAICLIICFNSTNYF
ncbi:hypothetical protein ANAEL_05441 [Anaerolineales bacterium]|nr:hypothetical protein ANAEL_05441 [Anaerolineales bacterium]